MVCYKRRNLTLNVSKVAAVMFTQICGVTLNVIYILKDNVHIHLSFIVSAVLLGYFSYFFILFIRLYRQWATLQHYSVSI